MHTPPPWSTRNAPLFPSATLFRPASISVLVAVEGLTVGNSQLEPLVIPIALTLLIFLVVIQRRGTAKVGALFAPVMIVYFVTIAVLGVIHIEIGRAHV